MEKYRKTDPYPYAKIGISKGPYCFVLQIISCRLHHNICDISLVSIFHDTGIKTNTLYYLLPLLYFYVFLGMIWIHMFGQEFFSGSQLLCL